jgi:hypothetical protein
MILRVIPLMAEDHSQSTLSCKEEKMALTRLPGLLRGSKCGPCRRLALSPIFQLAHSSKLGVDLLPTILSWFRLAKYANTSEPRRWESACPTSSSCRSKQQRP